MHTKLRYVSFAFALCCVGAIAATVVPQADPVPSLPAVSAPTSGMQIQSVDEKSRSELAATTMRLASVEASITKSSDFAEQVALRTSWFSFGTVFGTALLTATLSLLAQMLLMRHQQKINRMDSEAKVANTYVEWQLKQLSELYGPIRALLGQSNVLYRQMNRALVFADINRVRLVEGYDFVNRV